MIFIAKKCSGDEYFWSYTVATFFKDFKVLHLQAVYDSWTGRFGHRQKADRGEIVYKLPFKRGF